MHKITKWNLINCLIRHLRPSLIYSHLSNAQRKMRSDRERVIIASAIFLLQVTFWIYLSFGEIQGFCKLLSLLPNNILILFKSMFKLQQLTRREGSANSFWFSEGKKEFWELWTCKREKSCVNIEICCGKRRRITQIGRVQSVSHD